MSRRLASQARHGTTNKRFACDVVLTQGLCIPDAEAPRPTPHAKTLVKGESLREKSLEDAGFGHGFSEAARFCCAVSAAAVAESGVANVHKSGLLAHYSQRLVLLAAYIGSQG